MQKKQKRNTIKMNQFKARQSYSFYLVLVITSPFIRLTMSSMEPEVDTDAEQDLRDVFKLMYEDEDDWEIEEVRLILRRVMTADSRMIIHL